MKRTLPLLVWALCFCSLCLVVGCGGGSNPIVVAFPAGTAPMLDAGQSQNFTIMVAHDKNNQGVTWSLASAGTLSNMTPTSVTYVAPAGPLTATVTDHLTATSVADKTKSVTVAIVITPSLAIGTTSLPADVEGTAYNQTVAVTGGAGTLTYSTSVGALPAGLSLNGSTGAITGTPTGPNGTASFTVKVTDSSTANSGTNMGPQSKTQALSIAINLPAPPSITTSSLPNATQGAAYNQTVAATGGLTPYTFSISVGTLPTGLSMDSSGHITGMPTGSFGTSSFTVKVTDSSNPTQSATKNLNIIQQLVITTPAALPTGTVDQGSPSVSPPFGPPYVVGLASNGGTGAVTWAVASGSTLPGGLTLTASGPLAGQLCCVPTTAGTFHFSITATDTGTPRQTATVAFTLTITPLLAITTTQAQIPSGTAGTAYSTTTLMTNNGGIAPYTWAVDCALCSPLPPGLNINRSTGVISGTPTTAGTYNVKVLVQDSERLPELVFAAFSISIATAPLSVATTSLPNAIVGQAYNQTLASAGGNPPVMWSISAGSLPTWASLNIMTGAITGTPPNTTGSPFNFTVKATDSSSPAQTATQALTITVVSALSITTTQSQIPGGTVGTAYPSTTIMATGGTTPYSWSWAAQAGSSLPPGLSIASGTGVISGTPGGSGGTFSVTVTVADSATNPQQTASAPFSITITVATLMVTTTSGQLPTGTVSSAYPSTTLSASGGIPPYTWSQTGGTLPPGLSLSSSGAISGTPNTATGSPFSFTVMVTDSAAHAATATLSITVNAVAACTLAGKQLAFELFGDTSGGIAAMVGSITVASDGSVSGALDFRSQSALSANQSISGPAGSCSNSSVADAGTISLSAGGTARTLKFAMRADGKQGFVVESDSSGFSGTGQIQVQSSPSTPLHGSYGFGLEGGSTTAFFIVTGAACTNSSGTVTFLQTDVGITGTSILTLTGTSSAGTLSAPDANGRITSTSPLTYTNGTTVDSTFYNIDGTKAFMLNTGGTYPNGTGGTAPIPVQAGFISGKSGSTCLPTTAGSFTNSSIGNSVFSAQGVNSVGAPAGFIGVLKNFTPAAGTASITDDELNSGVGGQNFNAQAVTYSVSSVGRVTLGVPNKSGGTSNSFAYLDGTGNAYLMIGDKSGNGIGFGIVAPQTATTVGTGSYAFGSPIGPPSVAPISLLPVTEVSFTTTTLADLASGGSSGSFTCDSVGRCTAPALSNSVTFGDNSVVFYVGGNTDSATTSAFIVLLQTKAADAQNSMLTH